MRAVEAGLDVVGLDVDADRVKRLASGESFVEDIPADRLGRALGSGRYRPSTEYADAEGFDICVITVPTPLRDGAPDLSYVEQAGLTSARTSGPGARWCWSRPPIRAPPRSCSRPLLEAASGLRSRRRLPPRLQPGADRPGQPDLAAGEHPEGGLRRGRGVAGQGGRLLPAARRTDRAGGLDPGGRADQADREHLPAGQHRADQRAGDARRTSSASTSGRPSTPPRPSRSASCRSARARASAGTACRSTRATCPGRSSAAWAGSSGSSSWPTTSTTRCPSTSRQRVMAGLNRAAGPVNGGPAAAARSGVQEEHRRHARLARGGRGPAAARRSAPRCTRSSRTPRRSTSPAG